MLLRLLAFLAFFGAVATSFTNAAEFSLEQSDRGVTVNLDGKLFTEYLIKSGTKPILWPIIGPTGVAMTRAYPMEKIDGEKHDHPHHRSLWFTHGDVNGVDFWGEPLTYEGKKLPVDKLLGSIVHREFKRVAAEGDHATIVTVNDWIDSTGKKHCEDERTVTFRTDGDQRLIDFDIVLRATDEPALFGDTKEGSLGVRVPTAIDVKGGNGHIFTSEGLKDKEAWGKRARWVDYYGTIDGKTVGIAILNHPSSYRHPTPWHVRDYGLFASNPFGLHDFNPESDENGRTTLEPGQTLSMRHRIIFHSGDAASADIGGAYEKYAR
ncbi:MAG TPA: PmoA family protein [Pirellulales bacterium]|jgi:hypothetical protein|nr:PmoA family protein [Pirellulales bacterium]